VVLFIKALYKSNDLAHIILQDVAIEKKLSPHLSAYHHYGDFIVDNPPDTYLLLLPCTPLRPHLSITVSWN
jgi:hypothetical protein